MVGGEGRGGGSGGQVYVEFKLNHQIQEELCSRPFKGGLSGQNDSNIPGLKIKKKKT